MEKLLEMANQEGCQAEAYSLTTSENEVSFRTGALHDIESALRSGISLRIIRDGALGHAYTKNLRDRGELLQNALDSLKGGVEAAYEFPQTKDLPALDSYDASIAKVSSVQMVDECARVNDALKSRTEGEIHVDAATTVFTVRIMNTSGTDVVARSSEFAIRGSCVFPGSAAGISRHFVHQTFAPMPDALISEMADSYVAGEREITPQGGNMKVMFMPGSMITLVWRIQSGTSAKSVCDNISPIALRTGEQIWDEKLTVYDDPADDRFPGARPFDDEGVACGRFPLVENGVLGDFFNDLYYAAKQKATPTGHGFRTGMWGGDASTLKPTPSLTRMFIEPGKTSFADMVHMMDRGIILEHVLGAHSGNIPNGDFSVGVCPGFYVENGEIVGRVKDAMVAGNIYEMLKHLVAIGDTLYPSFKGYYPALLCESVSVATRG